MNPVWSIELPKGSLMLVDKMRTDRILPSDMESPRGVLEVRGIAGIVSICGVISNRIFNFAIL